MPFNVGPRPIATPRAQALDQRAFKPLHTVTGLGGAFAASAAAPIDALTLSEPSPTDTSSFRGTGTYSLRLPGDATPITGTYEAIGFTAGPGSMLILRDGADPTNNNKVKLINVVDAKRDAAGRVTELLAFSPNLGAAPGGAPKLFTLSL